MKNVMKYNKKLLLVITLLISSLVVLLSSFDDHDTPPPPSRDWQQDPPIAVKLTVQKLKEPLRTGENMAVALAYNEGDIQSSDITITIGDLKTTFYDDGKNGGDEKAGDNVFSAFVKEDFEGFAAQMEGFDETLRANNNTLDVFEGRVFSKVERREPLFDKKSFDAFKVIEISRDILRLPPDVSPVEGTLKTMDIKGGYGGEEFPQERTGYNNNKKNDLLGPYTHMSYGPPPPPPPIDKEKSLFITDLRVVRDPARTFNPCAGTFGSGNPNGAWTFASLVKGITNQGFTGITPKDLVKKWINSWMVDLTINSETVRNRSTKFLPMVIARWIQKARHNAGLSITPANWQTEWNNTHQDSLLRYAPFNLKAIVNRIDLRGSFGYGAVVGSPNAGETRFIWSLLQNTISGSPACRDSVGSGGLDGFNVIFEYGNVQTNCNAVKNLGSQWANLSTFNLNTVPGLNGYLAALQSITDLVTVPNANPSRTTNNKSAINQVRSNEIAVTNASTVGTDKSPRWQFREFKINGSTKLLEEVVLFNEPQNIFNGADGATAGNAAILAGWVNTHTAAIINQTTTGFVPLTVGGTPFQAGKSNYPSTSPVQAPGFWNGTTGAGPGFITDDKARFFFSNNTCSGCHAKQTETDFTMADYRGDNTAYNALSPSPTILVIGSQFKFDISPFLTGRSARFVSPNFVFGDDSTGVASEDVTDPTLTGVFYARDAAGRVYPGTSVVRKWGFNDLQRRAQDLTNLITSNCNIIFATSLASVVFFQPLNMAH